MQRIAVLLLCGGFWTTQASAQSCEDVGAVVGGFAGGATGYGIVRTLGVASNWVAAGLYGAGITVASLVGRSAAESGCDRFAENFRSIGETYCQYSGFDYDCGAVQNVARSLYADFAMCPSCTWDEVLGAFLLDDVSRQDYLRDMQSRRTGHLSLVTKVIPRNYIGPLSGSVLNSYFMGLQAGFTRMRTTAMYVNLR
jgi:hypothetical protein